MFNNALLVIRILDGKIACTVLAFKLRNIF